MNITVISVEDLLKLVRAAIREEIQQNLNQSRQNQASEYLSIEEAADYLRIPKNTLYTYCHQNIISYHKRGKRNFFLLRELDRWAASKQKKTVEEIAENATLRLLNKSTK